MFLLMMVFGVFEYYVGKIGVLGQAFGPCPLTSTYDRQWRGAPSSRPNELLNRDHNRKYRKIPPQEARRAESALQIHQNYQYGHHTRVGQGCAVAASTANGQLPYPFQAEHSWEIGSCHNCRHANALYLVLYTHTKKSGAKGNGPPPTQQDLTQT